MSNHSSPITAMAPALAPTTVDVRSCQAGSSSSWSASVTGLMVAAGDRGGRSAQLRDDLGGEELDVVQIGLVENLEVHALHAGLGERIQLVGDLAGRPHQR